MDVLEGGVAGDGLEEECPLVPCVFVYPFFPVEEVGSLEYSIDEEHVVSDDQVFLRGLRVDGLLLDSRHFQRQSAEDGVFDEHLHAVGVVVQDFLVG